MRKLDEPKEIAATDKELPVYTLKTIQKAIQSIRFGTIQLIIQDGHVIQIDKTEKIRLK